MVKTVTINNHIVKYPDVIYYLIKNAKDRVENKLDNIIIITGKVGSGKSNLSIGIGALYAHEMQHTFGVANVHFLIEDVLKRLYAHNNLTELIIHDEAVSGSSTRDSTSNLGKQLFKALITKRYKRHFVILNIDNIKELNKKVVERCVAWIHVSYVRTSKGYTKGLFKLFGAKVAEKVYLDLRAGKILKAESHPLYKSNKYLFKSYKYFDNVIDESVYEAKKDRDTSVDDAESTDVESVEAYKKLLNSRLLTAPLLLGLIIKQYKLKKSEICQNFGIQWNEISTLIKGDVLALLRSHEKDMLVSQEWINDYKETYLKVFTPTTNESDDEKDDASQNARKGSGPVITEQ